MSCSVRGWFSGESIGLHVGRCLLCGLGEALHLSEPQGLRLHSENPAAEVMLVRCT